MARRRHRAADTPDARDNRGGGRRPGWEGDTVLEPTASQKRRNEQRFSLVLKVTGTLTTSAPTTSWGEADGWIRHPRRRPDAHRQAVRRARRLQGHRPRGLRHRGGARPGGGERRPGRL